MPPDRMAEIEAERLAALRDLAILDSPPSDEFDAVVQATAMVCEVPIAVIGLLDDGREWFKAKVGLPGFSELPREAGFCEAAMRGEDILEIPDIAADARHAGRRPAGDAAVRFCAGLPLRLGSARLGALCVMDHEPRQLSASQRRILTRLARSAESALELWRLRRQQEAAARAGDTRLRRLYEATPAMLQSIDATGILVAASDMWLARLGYPRAEAIGRPATDFLTPESGTYVRTVARKLLFRTGRCDDLALRYRARDGEIIDMQMSAVVDGEANGQPAARLLVIQEVTAQLRAERALAQERQRLANTLAATGVATVEWHIDTGEARVSERWCQMIGWPAGQVPPLSRQARANWIHPEDLPAATAALNRHLAGLAERYEYEGRIRHRDGHYIWVQVCGAILTRTEAGAPEWMFSTLADIGERKRQQAALRDSEDFLARTGSLAGVGGWAVELDTGAVTWTAETYRISGLPLSHQPTLDSAIALYAPEAQPKIRALVEAAMAGGPPWDVELPFIRPDGQRIMVRVVGAAELLDGRPVRLRGAFQDVSARVAEREALRRAHERLARATASGRIGVWELDIERGTHSWDASMYRLYRIDPQQADDTYALWQQRLHPEDRAATEQAAQAALDGARPYDTEFRIVLDDGSIRHIRATGEVTRDADGRALRFAGANWDVTEARTLAAALEEERRRLADIIEATDIGTWEWHVPTGELHLNERWAAILGRTLEDLAPISIRTRVDLVHPDDLPHSLAALEAHFAGQRPFYRFELRMRHRDGSWVWVESRGKVVSRTADGRPAWVYGKMQDISERKQQEQALRRSEDFLERIGRLGGVGGWELDPVTLVPQWTAETRRIHGVPPDYRPSLETAIEFYAPEARPLIRAAVEHALAEGGGWDLELPLIRTSGERIWVRVVGAVEQADGRPVRIAGAFQDVTARVGEREALREAGERMKLATDSGGIGIWDWNLACDTMLWDDWMYRLYGVAPHANLGTHDVWRRHLHPEDRAAAEAAIREALDGIRPYDIEFRIVRPDGGVRHLRGTATITRDAEGRAVRMVGANWDVTEARQLAMDLAAQHELIRVTLRSIADGVITTDAAQRIAWLNPVAERMTGWTAEEARGRRLAEVFHIVNETTRVPTADPVAHCLKQNRVSGLASDTVLISRDGREFGIEDSAAPIHNDRGETLGAVLVFHDVTRQRQLSGEMSWRASHDQLTGLVNRGEFEARMRFLLHKAHADRTEHALMFIDLDQFKLVNDSCGHAAGDLLLQQVARLLTDAVRGSDTPARLGGDEFAVILDHCGMEQAQRLAQRICDRMEEYRFVHDARRLRIGASVGLVPVDHRWPNTAAVLQAADSACHAAKEAGRNRVHVWSDTDQAMRARQGETQLATRLIQALDEDRFVLFAQRIRRLGGDEPVAAPLHAEVLLRMQEADGSLAAPGAFLPAAERFHLASRIDRWVLGRVIAWMGATPALEQIETLCVNLSGQSVGDRAFHRWAIEVLSAAGPAICRRLCLEITETAAVTALADAAAFIAQVRTVGVRVALDDFGAGASSFGYLKTLPVDFLKIDGQFIRDLVADPLDEAAVRCFADVASVVGMRTVAEFVDSPEVLRKLALMGIDFAQGYLIHRPAPIDEVFWLAEAQDC
jgi:diguanylate cyclase (GGDEF)-like protein/PAS domain S-box-containing protein